MKTKRERDGQERNQVKKEKETLRPLPSLRKLKEER